MVIFGVCIPLFGMTKICLKQQTKLQGKPHITPTWLLCNMNPQNEKEMEGMACPVWTIWQTALSWRKQQRKNYNYSLAKQLWYNHLQPQMSTWVYYKSMKQKWMYLHNITEVHKSSATRPTGPWNPAFHDHLGSLARLNMTQKGPRVLSFSWGGNFSIWRRSSKSIVLHYITTYLLWCYSISYCNMCIKIFSTTASYCKKCTYLPCHIASCIILHSII